MKNNNVHKAPIFSYVNCICFNYCNSLATKRENSGAHRNSECPICHLIWLHDIEVILLEKHVNSHFNINCPVCGKSFKAEDDRLYSAHFQGLYPD